MMVECVDKVYLVIGLQICGLNISLERIQRRSTLVTSFCTSTLQGHWIWHVDQLLWHV